jgi:hypothetical protein
MEKKRIGRHFNKAFTVGPSQVLGWIVIKHIGYENTFLAIAYRTGHAAVVAIDTIGKISCHFFQAVGGRAGFDKHFIPAGLALRNNGVNGLLGGWGLWGLGKCMLGDWLGGGLGL